MINVLKALGFLTNSGIPTSRYHQYPDQTQSDLILAQAVREAYSDLFRVNRNAQAMGHNDVKQKMKTLSEGAFSDRVLTQMSSTFAVLCKLADWSTPPSASLNSAKQLDDALSVDSDTVEPTPSIEITTARDEGATPNHKLGLICQINIQLPESRDQGVYDAIFKALREHLR